MNNLKTLALIITLGSSSLTYAATFIGDDAHFNETREETYTKKTCRAGYKALKKEMKSDAKQVCRDQYDSPSWDVLKAAHFTKKNCEKNKVKGRKTTVTVKALFKVYCR